MAVKGQFFILTQAVFFLMILIAHFCLIIIIAPLDPFSLRFSNFQKMTTKKPKEKNAALGFILALVVWIIFFVNDMEDFFVSISHPFFFKVQMQNQKLGRCSFVVMVTFF